MVVRILELLQSSLGSSVSCTAKYHMCVNSTKDNGDVGTLARQYRVLMQLAVTIVSVLTQLRPHATPSSLGFSLLFSIFNFLGSREIRVRVKNSKIEFARKTRKSRKTPKSRSREKVKNGVRNQNSKI